MLFHQESCFSLEVKKHALIGRRGKGQFCVVVWDMLCIPQGGYRSLKKGDPGKMTPRELGLLNISFPSGKKNKKKKQLYKPSQPSA